MKNNTRPAIFDPVAAFDDPLEMLLACHRRIEKQLATLERLRAHLYRFNSTGDMANVLGDEVMRDIRAVSSIQMDMAAMEIVAWLYWYRSQALSGADFA